MRYLALAVDYDGTAASDDRLSDDVALAVLELQQIYVLRPWHGKGVADSLMEWTLGAAREDAAPEIYLTVFEHNERAKRFYSRYGFSEVGRCTFTLGERDYDDRVWRKPL